MIDPDGNSPLGNTLDLGDGWSVRADDLRTRGGTFEVHVSKGATEVGILNENGWVNRHGHRNNMPDIPIPDKMVNKLRGVVIDAGRRTGVIPEKRQGGY